MKDHTKIKLSNAQQRHTPTMLQSFNHSPEQTWKFSILTENALE